MWVSQIRSKSVFGTTRQTVPGAQKHELFRMIGGFMHTTHMITASLLGGPGYAGQETLDRVLAHPELELVALGSDSLAGEPAGTLDPRLGRLDLPVFVSNDDALHSGADVVFCCLGHARAT